MIYHQRYIKSSSVSLKRYLLDKNFLDFSSMVDSQESKVTIKTAIALSKMLEEAKAKGSSHSRIANNPDHIINSIGKIALETGLRKNTVSDIFNARKATKITTLVLILEALNKTIADFGKFFEKVTDSEIQKFKERSNLKKPAAAVKKKISKNN